MASRRSSKRHSPAGDNGLPSSSTIPKELQKEVKKLINQAPITKKTSFPRSFSGEKAKELLEVALNEVSEVYKLKITLSNTYYIRNRINEDAAKTLLGLSDDEQDLPLTDWKRK
ncbi:hypothetical protein GOP47_0024591 [Adiantum capillus-veneris]|uniref:Uncharacterized protein n=1 Tax=Adiantum capillus-veneris TaxID=13818 RepID=A0A9D4U214_ADICA|nr:hypothetical protein GOP47_0024591 [Adiantum capillus-veneris]